MRGVSVAGGAAQLMSMLAIARTAAIIWIFTGTSQFTCDVLALLNLGRLLWTSTFLKFNIELMCNL